MPDYQALKAELLSDPLTLGLAGKSDVQAAALLNGASRPTVQARTVVQAWEVYEAIDATEWAALAAAAKQSISDVLAMGTVNVAGTRARAAFGAAFAAGTASRTALLALSTLTVARSRAEEIFGSAVTNNDVNRARSLP